MKTLAISLIVANILLSFQIYTNIQQEYKISELSKKVRCLELGKWYVGDNLCANNDYFQKTLLSN